MPWTVDSPPPPAKNWGKEAIEKCVPVANAVLKKTGDKTKAIQACIRAAGKTVHPGGKGALFIELPEGMDDEQFCNMVEQADQMGLGFVTLEGAPEQFEIEYDDGRMMALGAVDPGVDWAQVRALYFRNAILARAESNRNRDRLPSEEIAALARTIGGMPIDNEHRFEEVVGVFTRGREVEDSGVPAVSVDGLLWPQRFPEIARETVSGERRLSMEVWIAAATCAECGQRFTTATDYCDHLHKRQADRILHGVMGFGGAVTVRPAGTDTVFDAGRMTVVASHNRDDDPISASEFNMVIDIMDEGEDGSGYAEAMAVLGGWLSEEALGKTLTTKERSGLKDSSFALIQTVTNQKTGKKVKVRRFPIHDCSHAANALARLSNAKNMSSSERASVKRKAQAKLNSKECRAGRNSKGASMKTAEELQQELDAALAKIEELEAQVGQVEELQTALANSRKAEEDLRWAIREQTLLQAGYDADKIEEKRETLATLSDDAFDMFVSVLADAKESDPPDPDGGDDDPPASVAGAVVLSKGRHAQDGGDDEPVQYVLILTGQE